MTRRDPGARDRLMAAPLAAGMTHEQAAATTGVSRKTIERRLSVPVFRRELDRARAELFDRVLGQAAKHATRAVEVLAAIMEDQNRAASVRVSAARALLDNSLRFREQVSLAERVARLEEALARQGEPVGGSS